MVDFAEYNRLRAILGCVGDHYADGSCSLHHQDRMESCSCSKTRLYDVPTEWLIAARHVLQLPTPVWNDPGSVAGEISHDKDTKMPPFGNKPAPVQQPLFNDNTPVLEAIKALDGQVNTAFVKLLTRLTSVEDLIAKLQAAPQAAPVETPRRRSAPAANPPAGANQVAAAPPAGAATNAPAQSVAADADLSTLSRRQLMEVADKLGIAHAGVKADDLRKLITDARSQNPGAGAANSGGAAKEMATILMKVIDDNFDAVKQYIEPVGEVDLPNNKLGCGGDCAACPNPEQYGSAAEQIAACFVAMHEMLGIQVPKL